MSAERPEGLDEALKRAEVRIGLRDERAIARAEGQKILSDGEWFARAFTFMLGVAFLVAVGIVLYAALRGFGRWLEVW